MLGLKILHGVVGRNFMGRRLSLFSFILFLILLKFGRTSLCVIDLIIYDNMIIVDYAMNLRNSLIIN